MREILFLLFAAIMFTSCRNDSEEVTPTDNKTYKVTFNISNIEVDMKPLKAETYNNQFHYRVYEKENGKVVKGWRYLGKVDKVEVELPAGDYYITFISHPTGGMGFPKPEGPIDVEDYNFYTDYFDNPPSWVAPRHFGNYCVYYEKAGFTVGADNKDILMDVALKPMWSEVDVEVSDAETYTLPEGTTTIACNITPAYFGFNIADGTSTKGTEDIWNFQENSNTTIDNFREYKGVGRVGSTKKYTTASKGVTVKLVFIKQEISGDTILGEREIYKGDIEGGKRITFKGALGKATSGTFNLSLADLKDGGVIPFN